MLEDTHAIGKVHKTASDFFAVHMLDYYRSKTLYFATDCKPNFWILFLPGEFSFRKFYLLWLGQGYISLLAVMLNSVRREHCYDSELSAVAKHSAGKTHGSFLKTMV